MAPDVAGGGFGRSSDKGDLGCTHDRKVSTGDFCYWQIVLKKSAAQRIGVFQGIRRA
jgi:hypothetical protein